MKTHSLLPTLSTVALACASAVLIVFSVPAPAAAPESVAALPAAR